MNIGLKCTITGEGVWRIRKREKIPMLQVFKVEETGYGDILSQSFVDWRLNQLPPVELESAKQAALSTLDDGKDTTDIGHGSAIAHQNGDSKPP